MAITNKDQAVSLLQKNIEWYNNEDAAMGGKSPFGAVRDRLQQQLDTLIARPDTIGYADIEPAIAEAHQMELSGRFQKDMKRLLVVGGVITVIVVAGIILHRVITRKPSKK